MMEETFCAFDKDRMCNKDCSAHHTIYDWQDEQRRERVVCGRGNFEINGGK